MLLQQVQRNNIVIYLKTHSQIYAVIFELCNPSKINLRNLWFITPMAIKAFIFASNSGMNISGVMMLLVIVAIVLIWILLKPKKTERRRFNLRERRLDREAEKDDKED